MKKLLTLLFAVALSISMSSFTLAQDTAGGDKPADKKAEKKEKKEHKKKKKEDKKKDSMASDQK